MTPPEEELLDVDEAIRLLQAALRLQYRSALGYAAAAGSVVGLTYAHLADSLWGFAQRDLEDARRLVEKIVTLAALPTTEVAPLRAFDAPSELIEWLIEAEEEATEALQDCIAATGREARSEALEHRLEHMIMRKQEQIDLLQRARRAA